MNIPKVFGNKKVLIVIALALILIILIYFINVDKIAFTGFAGQNSKNKPDKQTPQTPPIPPASPTNETTADNTNNNTSGSPFIINIVSGDSGSPSENQTYYYANLSSNTTQPTRGASHGKGGGGGGHGGGGGSGGIGSGSNPPYYNNSYNQTNNSQGYQTFSKRKLSIGKLKNNLRIKRNGIRINDGEEFEGKVRLSLDNKYDETISAFDINFTKDIDLSDIVADSDNISGKSFMHSTSGVLENIDLYVPKKDGDIAIIVCSGASSYDEIYNGCANEEILYLNNSRVEISSDGLYYIVHGITGTGATGVNVTEINSTSQIPPPPGSLEAMAGNITEVSTPEGLGKTQAWAGYFGNVSGTIQLADSGDNVLYNWSLASPEGEVFASTNNSISWNHIQCFNFTASSTYADEAGNGGTTNLYGTNLTQLETQFGIKSTDLDGVDETFYLKGAGTHNIFYVNANQFDEGECYNTRIFDSSGWGNDNNFEEVLLYEPTTLSVIFTSLLNEDVFGFDNRTHDFEMLVLENGHATDTSTTTYYFYAVMF